MIGKERRGENDGQVKSLLPVSVQHEAVPPLLAIPTPFGVLKITGRRIWLAVALTVFIILLNVRIVDGTEAGHCFAILIFATILWATEVGRHHAPDANTPDTFSQGHSPLCYFYLCPFYGCCIARYT